MHAASRTLGGCPHLDLPRAGTLALPESAGAKLVVVECGTVLLTSTACPGRPTVLALAGRGDVLAPLGPDERLRALTDARVILVPAGAYEALLALPSVARALLDGLVDTLERRQQTLMIARSSHADRLRETLFELARDHGKVGPDGVQIDLPLTHELLAQMVGSARETVTCALARFQREGLLVRNGRSYCLTIAAELLESR